MSAKGKDRPAFECIDNDHPKNPTCKFSDWRIIFIRKYKSWQYWEMVGPGNFRVIGKRKCDRAEIEERLNGWIKRVGKKGLGMIKGRLGGRVLPISGVITGITYTGNRTTQPLRG